MSRVGTSPAVRAEAETNWTVTFERAVGVGADAALARAAPAFVNVDAYSGVVAGVVVPRLADALCDVVFNDAEAVGVTARVGAGVVAGVEGNHLTAHRKPYLLTIQRDQIGLLLYGLGNKFSFEVVQIFSKIFGPF